jgi:hypothetical protein
MGSSGGGTGSTIGGLVGGIGGSYFGPVGTMVGGAAGSAIGSQFDKKKKGTGPGETPQPFDPYGGGGFDPQLQAIESAVFPQMGMSHASRVSLPGGAWNPYVGPRPEQTAAIEALQDYQRGASPLYGQSVGQQGRTVGGEYLDPMTSAPFQRLADARLNYAKQLFSDFAPQYSSAAGARGVPAGSAREAGVQRGAERIAGQAAQDIASAGFGQYGAERGYQEAAGRYGTQLAPALASQVFGAGEQLRGAQQAGATAQMTEEGRRQIAAMEGQLRAMGLDDAAINTALRYMALRGLQRPERAQPSQGGGLLAGLLSGQGAGGLSSLWNRGPAGGGASAPSGSVMGSSMGYWV